MAELGDDLLTHGPGGRDVEVTLEMMDYGFVDACDDAATLRAVLRKLKDGEGGRFPHLEAHVEARLLEHLSPKERGRLLRLRSRPQPRDVKAAEDDLVAWEAEVERLAPATGAPDASEPVALPPPRGQARLPPPRGQGTAPAAPGAAGAGGDRISGYDFAAWDKFDVDAAETAVDAASAAEVRKVEDAADAQRRLAAERKQRKEAELQAALDGTRVGAALSAAKATFLSTREKQKGNECYRAGETEEAYLCYTKALALMARGPADFDGRADTEAVLHCNRAMACIKLERLDRAEADCDEALALNPNYTKARQRRGMVRHKRGKYLGAIGDFEEALRENPSAKDLGKLLLLSRKKLAEVGGGVDGKAPRKPPAGLVPRETRRVGAEVVDVTVGERTSPLPLPLPHAQVVVAEHPLEPWDGDLPPPTLSAKAVNGKCLTPEASRAAPEENPAPAFHRVPVVIEDDDDDDEDEDREAGAEEGADAVPPTPNDAAAPLATDFRRLSIEEASESDEAASPPRADVDDIGGKFTRISVREAGSAIPRDDAFSFEEVGMEELAHDKKERGNVAVGAGDLPNALALFREALALLPADHSLRLALHNNMAVALLQQQDWAGVVEHTSLALAMDPENVKALARRAVAQEASGQCKEAISDLLRLQSITPDDEAVTGDLARLKAGLGGGSSEAVGSATATPAPAPGAAPDAGADPEGEGGKSGSDEEGHAGRGWRTGGETMSSAPPSSGDRLGYWKDKLGGSTAERAQERSEIRAASDAEKTMGNDLMRNKDFPSAIRAYTAALRLDESNVAARNNRAQARLKLGDYAGALEDADAVLREDPDNAKARYRRALAGIELGNVTALDDLRKIVQDEPRNVAAKEALAAAERRFGSGHAQAADAACPLVPESVANLAAAERAKDAGNALVGEGNYEGAVSAYTEALQHQPDLLAARNNRSQAYIKLGTPASLRRGFEDASAVLAAEPRNAKALFRRGAAALELVKQGAVEATGSDADLLSGCTRDLERLLELSPGNKAAHRALQSAAALRGSETAIAPERPTLEPVAPAPSLVRELASPPSPKAPLIVAAAAVSPATPSTSRSAAEMNERVSSAMKRALDRAASIKVTVPAAPTTLYDFERSWRGLKGDREATAKYFRQFRLKHFKRVIKESTDMEVFSSIFGAAKEEMEPAEAVTVLSYVAKTDPFAMVKLLFSDEDRSRISDILDAAEGASSDLAQTVAKCRAAYA